MASTHRPQPNDKPSPIPYENEFLRVEDEDDYNIDASGFDNVVRDPESWAGALPANQGLYMNEQDRDSCGVGFICQIKGIASHKIVSDARQLLCAMTHRGATGADARDGDGAGVMTGIPHRFFKREAERDLDATLPEPGQYAVGNVFFNPTDAKLALSQRETFEKIADGLGLRVLGWREVPTDSTILGPAARSKEPIILQPFVVLKSHYGTGKASEDNAFDEKNFEKKLFVLRKHATHTMFVSSLYYRKHAALLVLYYSLDHLSYRLVFVSYLRLLNCRRRSAVDLPHTSQLPRQVVLRLLPLDQEHRLQGSIHPSSSIQLLPRPQPCSLHRTLRSRPLAFLHEHLSQLGPCSAYAMGRPQR